VLAGMPAVESLEDVIDAEVVRDVPAESFPHRDGLLGEIAEQDSNLALQIKRGFEQLSMNDARQLQRLVEFRGKPADLLAWLKDEWAARQGSGRKKADVLGVDPGKPGGDHTVKVTVQNGQVVDVEHKPTPEPTPAPTKPARPAGVSI
jgi:hypothetical protein